MVSWAARQADYSLCVSQASADALVREFNCRVDRVGVYHAWVGLEELSDEIAAVKADRPLIHPIRLLFVGRLSPEKGVRELLELVRYIDRSGLGDRYHLTIVGDSTLSLADEVRRAARETVSLTFAGRVDKPALWGYFATHDIFVFPSQCEEGFGNVVLESYTFGTPVIGARRGGIPEVLANFPAHRLVDSCDPETLLVAADAVWTDIHVIGRRALLARSHAVLKEYFSVKNFDVYRTMVERLIADESPHP